MHWQSRWKVTHSWRKRNIIENENGTKHYIKYKFEWFKRWSLTRKFAKSKLDQRFRLDFSKAFYPLFYWLDGYDIYPPIVHLSLRFGTFLMAKASQMQSLTLMTLIFSPLLSAISENLHFQSISNLVWKWKPRFDRNGWKGKYVE